MTIYGNIALLAPIFWPIIGAFIAFLIGKKSKNARDYFVKFVAVSTFGIMFALVFGATTGEGAPYFMISGFMGDRIHFRLDGLRAVYGLIASFMWMMTTLVSREYFAEYRNRNRYYLFSLLTLGGTMGVFFSADLFTTFVFFELMSIASYVMVIHDEKPATLDAARTYMAVAVIGGLALLFGILIVNSTLGTTEIAAIFPAMQAYDGSMGILYLAGVFMLVGFGGKAGMYPLHIWLPNAHPVAPAPASALLSGVLTKTGVFGLIIVSLLLFNSDTGWGFLMLNIGIIGMITGAMLALFSTDLKRTLAYSSVSQIGFIILGLGMANILVAFRDAYYHSLAIHGTMLHMVNHSLIKLLLFMAAGVVYLNVHHLDLNKIRGFGRGKPIFTIVFLMGALAIIGMPLWSGYISKTLLHDTLVYYIMYGDFEGRMAVLRYFQILEGVFTITGGLTTAYMTKLFICICVEKNQFDQAKMDGKNKKYMGKLTAGVLIVCAALLPILGLNPDWFMIPIASFGHDFMMLAYYPYALNFWAWMPISGVLASFAIGAILYIFVVRMILTRKDEEGRSIYVNLWPSWLDIEHRIYRPLLKTVLPAIGGFFAKVATSIVPVITGAIHKGLVGFRGFWHKKTSDRPERSFLQTIGLSGQRGEFVRIIFGSLLYALLIVFIGFTVVQLLILFG
ncbi:MAG: sodium:proton antiporter [Clostridiales bacterium]|jgi:hydrogenase-4 component B|nr:sodium:proton antiporter [Clostridiales bacterium]